MSHVFRGMISGETRIKSLQQKGGVLVEKCPMHIECVFAESGDIEQILHRSFVLYLDRRLVETAGKAYNRQDEWPLISGGQLCT